MDITYYLRRFWLEGSISKIINLQNEIEDLGNDTLLKILTGELRFIYNNGYMETTEDEPEEELSVESVCAYMKDQFEYSLIAVLDYSFSLEKRLYESPEDFEYGWNLSEKAWEEYKNWELECKHFKDLTGKEVSNKSQVLNEYYRENSSEEISLLMKPGEEDYITFVKEQLKILDFSSKHALNKLAADKNLIGLQTVQITKTNGLDLMIDHKVAQRKAESLRGDEVFPEKILETIWNSGWLAPNGDFYGCSDLNHISYSKDLLGHLGLETVEGDPSRGLEVAGFIKFSSGRWLFLEHDLTPTQEQLQVIIEWAKYRNDSPVVIFRDSEPMTIEMLKSRAIGAPKYDK